MPQDTTDRMFTQLDQLEAGARRGPRMLYHHEDVYNDSSAEYSANDNYGQGYTRPPYPYGQADEQFTTQSMLLDSFDEALMRQPDHDSRNGQASLGLSRLSLPPASSAMNLAQYVHNAGPTGNHSSDSFDQRPLHSSPTFNASQRRPTRPARTEQHGYRPQHEPKRVPDPVEDHMAFGETNVEKRPDHGSRPQPAPELRPSFMEAMPDRASAAPHVGPPLVQGIQLVPTRSLPDRLRSIFPFPLFNAVQSKCFDTIYNTTNNFVVAAPTGSGKTALLELAICRLINGFAGGTYKIVYQAPTKSLCAERQRDWQTKFAHLDLRVAELTGDTENASLHNVATASIIVTTPEKWDSITRKWKDHEKLMQLVRLFLIDEVHILKEDRGATLEAVVSRMKSVGSDVRFVALSATVPNSNDIATWLGQNPMNPHIPASRERFGEEFRPVRLTKHVCGYQSNGNDFSFEKILNNKLPEVIAKWSKRKPIMVFCFTRSACVETAKMLSNWWTSKGPRDRYWETPRGRVVVADKDLRDTVPSGVAFHHAGLSMQDRSTVERSYLNGELNVICCTSTLAVGVNLPCHMVIIKNTVAYANSAAGGCKEYSDLEVMQMLGRAGRPQFDDSAVAIILTRLQKVHFYEKMVSGKEVLESCLHRNLIDHLNAEIGLGTVTSVLTAKRWLSGTFLYVRLKENPEHYKIDGDAPGRNLDERLENICAKGIGLLQEYDLVENDSRLRCTEFGDAMARYYLQFETMKLFLAMPPKAKLSEILSSITQAAEFKELRFRGNEKTTYKILNKNGAIKFQIPVNIDMTAHKVSLIIQSVLGAVDVPSDDHKVRLEYTTSKANIFQHVHRLIRCIIDCQLYLEDSVSVRNALTLARSLGAQVWDDSPLHLKQLDGIGLVSVRKLVAAGIKSIEDVENTEAHSVEQALSRNPPYGAQLQEKARAFPKLRISVKMMGEPVIKKDSVSIKVKADISFLNERIPETFNRKVVYVVMLAETSDGHKVHFCRISAKKLSRGQDVLFCANVINASQSVRCYVMCDEIAGTLQHATLKPEIPPSAFPPTKLGDLSFRPRPTSAELSNVSKPRAAPIPTLPKTDEFDDGIDDADLVAAESGGFRDIDEFDETPAGSRTGIMGKPKRQKIQRTDSADEIWQPRQLKNGKWACNHACKDKMKCRHLCCKEGIDKPQKQLKQKDGGKDPQPTPIQTKRPKQTHLTMPVAKKKPATDSTSSSLEELDMTEFRGKRDTFLDNAPRAVRNLNRLHNSAAKNNHFVPNIGTQQPAYSYAAGVQPKLSFLETAQRKENAISSDYGGKVWSPNDLLDHDALPANEDRQGATSVSPPTDPNILGYLDEDEMLDAPLSGHDDSKSAPEDCGNGNVDLSWYTNGYGNDTNPAQTDHWQADQASEADSCEKVLGAAKALKKTDVAVTKVFMTNTGSADTEVEPIGRPTWVQGYTKRSYAAAHSTNAGSSHSFASKRQKVENAMGEEALADFHADEPAEVVDNSKNVYTTAPHIQDSTLDWFNSTFGTDLFNVTG